MTPLRLHRLEVSNFMRVEAFSVDAEGHSVIIRAQNTEGKSSVIEAIWELLAGSSAKDRPEPIHEGADRAILRCELTDDDGNIMFIVEKRITAKSRSLVVTTPDGKKHPGSAQDLLNGFLDKCCLDPVAFLERRPQDQLDDILQVCGIEPPVTQVKMLTGEAHQPNKGESADKYLERLSADDVGLFYRRRLAENQEVTRIRGAIEKQRQEVKRLQDELAFVPETSLDKLQATLEAKRLESRKYQNFSEMFKSATTTRSQLGMQLQHEQGKRDAARKKVQEIEAALKLAQEHLRDCHTNVENAAFDEREYSAEWEKQKHHLGTLVDPTPEILKLEKEISVAVSSSKKVIERDHAVKRHDELEKELDVASKRHNKTDIALNELRTLRKNVLEGVDLGVTGLSVDGGELRLNGKTFKQASHAERINVSCAVAMKRNPRLKLLRVDNGEALDKRSREYLLSLAEQRGWQVIMACVADNEGLAVEIVDKE